MNCKQLQTLLPALQEHELDAATEQAVQEHLTACARCAREERLLRLTRQALRALPRPAPRPDFAARALARLPLDQPRPWWQWVWPPVSVRLSWVAGAAVAAVLLWAMLSRGPSPSGPGIPRGVSIAENPPEATVPTGERPAVAQPGDETGRGRAREEQAPPERPSPKSKPSPALRPVRAEPPRGWRRVPPRPAPTPQPVSPAVQLAGIDQLLAERKYQAAVDQLNHFLGSQPAAQRAAGYRRLVRAYQALYRLEDAVEAHTRLCALQPEAAEQGAELADRLLAEAQVLLAEGQPADAAEKAQLLLAHELGGADQQAQAGVLLAQCHASRGDRDLAQATHQRLARQFPAREESAATLLRVAQSLEEAGEEAAAAETYQQLVDRFADDQGAVIPRAVALKRSADLLARRGADEALVAERYAQARTVYQQALRTAAPTPQRGALLLGLAEVQEALHEEEAIATYYRVRHDFPGTEYARQADQRLTERLL